jgi:CRISPR-associated protein Csb1
MDLAMLEQVVAGACALRFRQKLQPAGGPGDKVFPPTYEGAQYAEETRLIDGVEYLCIHLDSVQSQANRMELALLEAARAGKIELPIVSVDFAARSPDLRSVGVITSLDAPHRLADAILRDSEIGGVMFRKSPEGQILDSASYQNASGLFGICPTALLFGIWDSTGPRGSLGVKIQRSIVSEVVAVGAVKGVKTSSRIDPLGITKNAGPLYVMADGTMTIDASKAVQENGQAVLYGRKKDEKDKKDEGTPARANHGNIIPSIQDTNGGITFSYALQTTTISFPALRRLRFPVGGYSAEADQAGRTVIAALGISAASLSVATGYDFRSRCLLVPETQGTWEIVAADGGIQTFSIGATASCNLLREAAEKAKACGLPWRAEGLSLVPSEGLVQLVTRSRELAAQV